LMGMTHLEALGRTNLGAQAASEAVAVSEDEVLILGLPAMLRADADAFLAMGAAFFIEAGHPPKAFPILIFLKFGPMLAA